MNGYLQPSADTSGFVQKIGDTMSGPLNINTPTYGVQVIPSSSSALILQSYIAGDVNYRLVIKADGTMSWGNGVSGVDISLFRSAAGVLTIGGSVIVNGTITYNEVTFNTTAIQCQVSGDTLSRFYIRADGYQAWGSGVVSQDVWMLRSVAGKLQIGGSGTDGFIQFDISTTNPTIVLNGGSTNSFFPVVDLRPSGNSALGGTYSVNSSAGGLSMAGRGGIGAIITTNSIAAASHVLISRLPATPNAAQCGFVIQNSSGASLFEIRSDGNIWNMSGYGPQANPFIKVSSGSVYFPTGITTTVIPSSRTINSQINLNWSSIYPCIIENIGTNNVTSVPLVVAGASGQTANVQEWWLHSADGIAIVAIKPTGQVYVKQRDVLVDNSTYGVVLKDTSNSHYYRISITAGVVTLADLGLTAPT